MIKIYFTNRQKYLTINKKPIEKIIKSSLSKSGYPDSAISVVFVDNRRIRQINRRFLKRNRITDVIAFPLADAADNLLGEIIISAEEAVRQGRRRNIPPCQELLLYCVHGLLHLVGYDDTTPRKRKIMWQKQADILGDGFIPVK